MEPSTSTPQSFTLQQIAALKSQKRKELLASRERIRELGQDLFAPQVSDNKMQHIMNYVNAGMSAYDGLLTGLKVYRRIRALFPRKKYPTKTAR